MMKTLLWFAIFTAPLFAEVVLKWNDTSTNETSFKIERALGNAVFSQIATTAANVATFTDTTVTPSTTYWYRVRASNATGDSAYSNTLTVSTPATPPPPPPGTSGTFANTTPIVIPGVEGPASPYPSPVTAASLTGTVATVSVQLLGFNHTWSGDVDIILVGPAGQKMLLLSDCGTSEATTNATLTFSDAATVSVPQAGALSTGTYKPTNYADGFGSDDFSAPAPGAPYADALSAFNGQPANGTWSLYVRDDSIGHSGSIDGGWSLTINTTAAPPPPPPPPAGPTAIDVHEFTFVKTATATKATIIVRDSAGTGIAGVVLRVRWSGTGITTAFTNGTTNVSGQAVITSPKTKTVGTVTAQIIGVTVVAGTYYNSSLNSPEDFLIRSITF